MKQLVGTARNLMQVVVEGEAGHDRGKDATVAVGMGAELVLMLADNEWAMDRKGKTLAKKAVVETVKFLVTPESMLSLIRSCVGIYEEMRAIQGSMASMCAAGKPAEGPEPE